MGECSMKDMRQDKIEIFCLWPHRKGKGHLAKEEENINLKVILSMEESP